jgi:hypothetical protein
MQQMHNCKVENASEPEEQRAAEGQTGARKSTSKRTLRALVSYSKVQAQAERSKSPYTRRITS